MAAVAIVAAAIVDVEQLDVQAVVLIPAQQMTPHTMPGRQLRTVNLTITSKGKERSSKMLSQQHQRRWNLPQFNGHLSIVPWLSQHLFSL